MPTTKTNDEELFAKAIVEDLFREFGPLEKRESPDFQGADMGLEVTSACVPLLYQQKGDYTKWITAPKQNSKQLEKINKLKKKACGEHKCDGFTLQGSIETTKFGDVHITTMCGDLHHAGLQWILNAVEKKCKKLNKSFAVFGTNMLFITTAAPISTMDEVMRVFQAVNHLYINLSDSYSIHFDIILIYSESLSKIAILDFRKSRCGIADIDSHVYDAMFYNQPGVVLTREFDIFMKQLLFPKFEESDGSQLIP